MLVLPLGTVIIVGLTLGTVRVAGLTLGTVRIVGHTLGTVRVVGLTPRNCESRWSFRRWRLRASRAKDWLRQYSAQALRNRSPGSLSNCGEEKGDA